SPFHPSSYQQYWRPPKTYSWTVSVSARVPVAAFSPPNAGNAAASTRPLSNAALVAITDSVVKPTRDLRIVSSRVHDPSDRPVGNSTELRWLHIFEWSGWRWRR